jgi:hypothetical protein
MPKLLPSDAFIGKLGRYTGFNLDGVTCLRTCPKPFDPQTPAQMQVRDAFKEIGEIAETINCGILRPYTFPRPRGLSAYDHMTEINGPALNAPQWNPAALKIFDGSLYNPGIKTAQIILTRKRAAVYITFDPQGGEPSDIACLVVNDEAARMTYFTTETRKKGGIDIAIAPKGYPPDFSRVYAYLCFAQKPDGSEPGSQGQNSPTAFKQATLSSDELTQALAR